MHIMQINKPVPTTRMKFRGRSIPPDVHNLKITFYCRLWRAGAGDEILNRSRALLILRRALIWRGLISTRAPPAFSADNKTVLRARGIRWTMCDCRMTKRRMAWYAFHSTATLPWTCSYDYVHQSQHHWCDPLVIFSFNSAESSLLKQIYLITLKTHTKIWL